MLAISQSAQDALAEYAKPHFAGRIRVPLTKKYVSSLGRFPEPVRDIIVDNLLARADTWELKTQAATLAFCEFMLAIAPNFDEEPDLRAALERGRPTRDHTVMELPEKAPAEAWERARRNRSSLALYIPRDLIGAPVLDQTVAALPLVLFDRQLSVPARTLVEQALPTAMQLGLRGLADAPLVVAVCRSIWGADFHLMPWVSIMMREHLPPQLVLAALRLRLAEEQGRFV